MTMGPLVENCWSTASVVVAVILGEGDQITRTAVPVVPVVDGGAARCVHVHLIALFMTIQRMQKKIWDIHIISDATFSNISRLKTILHFKKFGNHCSRRQRIVT